MVLINATYGACGCEGFEHAVSPPTMAMLEGLDDLQIQVYVYQVSYL